MTESRTERDRLLGLINGFGASETERRLYAKGVSNMTEAEAKKIADDLDAALDAAPAALEALERLISKSKEKR